MKKHFIDIIKIAVGLIMAVTAIYTYLPYAEYMYHFTFITNMGGAILFIVDGILGIIKNKSIPNVLYLMHAVAISFVFLITEGATVYGMTTFNLDDGAMVFLHIINPIVVIVCYLCLGNDDRFSVKKIFLSPMIFISYLLFDYIRFMITHHFVYGLFSEKTMTHPKAVIIGLIAYTAAAVLGLIFHSTRCRFARIINKNKLLVPSIPFPVAGNELQGGLLPNEDF